MAHWTVTLICFSRPVLPVWLHRLGGAVVGYGAGAGAGAGTVGTLLSIKHSLQDCAPSPLGNSARIEHGGGGGGGGGSNHAERR
ncbi:predicted protein [Plenodomus lingam JN3]|uniref:Predicted protein n=2 Tax=Leptosphaeria maculans TaxID=5022 RepID=E4ZNK5_LEPMJ|nr:predicted protein [Plenodomus lingam JN3]CBX93064.1 predicted protein [Plenodomus lingam JN3]